MNVQWFPGHMTKTRKQITEDLKLVDIVYELADARLPLSSRNPEIDKILGEKPRILLLNKCDLADSEANKKWTDYFKKSGVECVLVSCSTGKGIDELLKKTKETLKDVSERRQNRGVVGNTIRVMIVGIPNVGKSSLINRLSKRAGTKTADRPGVTKTKQWVTVKNEFMLLDTPGILWPKFDDEMVGKRLAFTGAIKDEILDVEELAVNLLDILKTHYGKSLNERYGLTDFEKPSYEVLEDIGRKRGCVISGGNIETLRAANILMDEFRAAKLGNITLELPEQEN